MQELSVCRSAVVHNNAEHLFGVTLYSSLACPVLYESKIVDVSDESSLSSDDRMIPPAAQRSMATRARATVSEEKGGHAIDVSQPTRVADLIEQAAMALSVK